MLISVRDYRGVERADVELAPLALVAGMNEQGKSCLAEAVRAALAGVPIPIPGVAKKDARLLVRDGAESGHVEVSDEGGGWKLHWPGCDFTTDRDGGTVPCATGFAVGLGPSLDIRTARALRVPCATGFAVGLGSLLDLNERERPKALGPYIDGEPTKRDLASEMADAGYGEDAIDDVWRILTAVGWDGAYKRVREDVARLKGQWEGITHERYGSKKAADWRPEGLVDEAAEAPIEALHKVIDEAKAKHESIVGRVAVSEAKLNMLRESAEQVPRYEKEVERAEERLREKREHLHNLSAAEPAAVPPMPMRCPKCKAVLKLDGDALVAEEKAPTKAQIAKARKAREGWEAEMTRAKFYEHQAVKALDEASSNLTKARLAAEEIEEITAQQDGEPVSETDIAAARLAINMAQEDLHRRLAWELAQALHREIEQTEKLAEILAPEGLRRRRLALGLRQFNARLAQLCRAADWPAVQIDESLRAHYGTRPVWAASKSGQWRARVVLQLAMAQIDGSAAVVIDEADILDARGRNALFALLKAAEIPALVCMTMSKPELVPDLEAAGMGKSYWLEAGVANPIRKAREKAA